eukprot:TRINITY_DN1320_c1_g1_i7.p1 TRINITY_DN1320_c1_g1~~TRINITY_DN1320_c1_g1_i7.p1  ORF type:complete len:355 (+),score=26.49 TRINITY_DN1320_c1_g1_i7:255-1319(+)
MSAHAIQNTSENVPEQYDEPQCNKVDGNTKRSRTKRQRCKNIQSQSPLDNKLPKKRAKQDKPYVGALYDEQTMRTEVAYKGGILNIVSWNVAGLRGLLKKDVLAIKRVVCENSVDVMCLQETKLQEQAVPEVEQQIKEQLGIGWNFYWNCCNQKKGYAGTALFAKLQPMGVVCGVGIAEHDQEGRVIAAEFDDLIIFNTYVPNAGSGLRRLDYRVNRWDQDFSSYVQKICQNKKKLGLIIGDMNCAREEIDIRNPKTNLKSAGFTVEERNSFQKVYIENGFVDTFREQHPGIVAYSYWGYRFNCREKNIGWRLDYAMVMEGLMGRVLDSYMLQKVLGSDHCPIGIKLQKLEVQE